MKPSEDIIVVVPGIGGSVLEEGGQVIWGKAWSTISAVFTERLAVTPQEQDAAFAGRPAGRVRATGLIKTPTWLPDFGSLGAYRTLTTGLRALCPNVLEFPYDWRLPVSFNAPLLARAALSQLESSGHPGAGLVIIAHSMGGMITREACLAFPEFTDSVRTVITLGTPFRGATKAAAILGGVHTSSLVRRTVARLAATMPGVHDLLPTYHCLPGGETLNASDVISFGGNAELFERSRYHHRPRGSLGLPGHRLVVGTGQSTPANLTINAGKVMATNEAFDFDTEGRPVLGSDGTPVILRDRVADGTVPRYSAEVGTAEPISARHGSLPGSAWPQIEHILTGRPGNAHLLGPDDMRGLEVPDLVSHGSSWPILLTGAFAQPPRVTLKGPTRRSLLTTTECADPLDPSAAAFLAWAPQTLEPGLHEVTAAGLMEHVYITVSAEGTC